jgi:hypothetical protein
MARKKTRTRTRSRSRSGRKFNTKLAIDSAGAALIIDLLPSLIAKWFPGVIDPQLYTVAGLGGTFAAAKFLKRPDILSAGLGLAVVKFIEPMISGLVGGEQIKIPGTGAAALYMPAQETGAGIADFVNLNDYTYAPARRNYYDYSGSY